MSCVSTEKLSEHFEIIMPIISMELALNQGGKNDTAGSNPKPETG